MQGNTSSVRTQSVEELLADNRHRFLDYVRARIADPELAEDILQDSLLRAVHAAPDLRDEERVIPWFYRILRNAIIDAYRRRDVEGRYLSETDTESLAHEPEDQMALCDCFRDLIPTLKPEYGELIQALDLGEETPEQVATRLGITTNNLKVRRHRARQALRQRLVETCKSCADNHCLDCSCGSI